MKLAGGVQPSEMNADAFREHPLIGMIRGVADTAARVGGGLFDRLANPRGDRAGDLRTFLFLHVDTVLLQRLYALSVLEIGTRAIRGKEMVALRSTADVTSSGSNGGRKATMTEQDEQGRKDRWKVLGIRTGIPHPARVYDYLLGGKDNFAVDREAAEMSLKISPEILDSARANRKFLVRAVRFLCDNGIRQFLDVGTGLPTSPNTYEVARAGHPDARVVYVDNDPVVFLHAESLMADNETTTVVRADLRDVDEVLAETGKLLDFAEPVGLLFVACLHNIPESDDPAGIVSRYLSALAPGSYLVISHATDEFDPERMHAITAEYARRGTVFVGRSKEAIRRLFNGIELVDPGVVLISYWRPEGSQPDYNADRVWGYCGVARV
jgi:SAM-dependent methyltransferase